MNLRLACVWLYERWVDRTAQRIAADEDKDLAKARDKAERQYRAAVAEVDAALVGGPPEREGPSRERAEFFRAMGAEVA